MQFHMVQPNTHPFQDTYLCSVITLSWQIFLVSDYSAPDPVLCVAGVPSSEPNGHDYCVDRAFSLVGTSGLQQNEQLPCPFLLQNSGFRSGLMLWKLITLCPPLDTSISIKVQIIAETPWLPVFLSFHTYQSRVGIETKHSEARCLGLKFHFAFLCVIWEVYLAFCAPASSLLKEVQRWYTKPKIEEGKKSKDIVLKPKSTFKPLGEFLYWYLDSTPKNTG